MRAESYSPRCKGAGAMTQKPVVEVPVPHDAAIVPTTRATVVGSTGGNTLGMAIGGGLAFLAVEHLKHLGYAMDSAATIAISSAITAPCNVLCTVLLNVLARAQLLALRDGNSSDDSMAT